MCFGELPSVNDTLFSWPKRSHWFIEPPLFREGIAIPEGAPLSSDHCIYIYIYIYIKLSINTADKIYFLKYATVCFTVKTAHQAIF